MGDRTDWYRKPRAAGGGVLYWQGERVAVADLEVDRDPRARAAFHPVEQLLLGAAGIPVVRLRPTDTVVDQHDHLASSVA